MATFKLEVKKEVGQLHHRVYATNADAPDFGKPVGDLKKLLESVAKSLETAGVGKKDTVIFRSIGYENQDELREAVRTATY